MPDETAYLDHRGILTACCHCRRTRQVRETAVWDWVPSYVEEPPERVSHGICAVCLNLFYPEYCEPLDGNDLRVPPSS